MKTGWDMLNDHQQAAGVAASRLIQDADLTYVLMLLRDDKVGAVISNIAPPNAVELIEGALRAAKSMIEIEEIGAARLQ